MTAPSRSSDVSRWWRAVASNNEIAEPVGVSTTEEVSS